MVVVHGMCAMLCPCLSSFDRSKCYYCSVLFGPPVVFEVDACECGVSCHECHDQASYYAKR